MSAEFAEFHHEGDISIIQERMDSPVVYKSLPIPQMQFVGRYCFYVSQ